MWHHFVDDSMLATWHHYNIVNKTQLNLDCVTRQSVAFLCVQLQSHYCRRVLFTGSNWSNLCQHLNRYKLSLSCFIVSALDSIRMLGAMARSMMEPVRLTVTRVDQSKTVEVRIMKFSPYVSPIPQFFAGLVSSMRNSDGFPSSPERWRQTKWDKVARTSYFLALCVNISKTARDSQ